MKSPRYWYGLLALGLIVAVAGWLRTDGLRGAREVVYPFENAVAWVERHVVSPAGAAFRRADQAGRLRELQAEIERLRLDAVRLEAVADENRRLRAALNFPAPPGCRAVACPVLAGGGTTGWERLLRVGKGSRDGLRTGDPVLVADGLVGRVDRVASHTADVRLLSDPNSRVACEIDPPPAGLGAVRGVLCGGGGRTGGGDALRLLFVMDPLRLRFLKRDAEPAPRSRVITSGLGEVLPRGVPVGFVLASTAEPNGLYREADVAPAADLEGLTLVFALVTPADRGTAP